MNLKSAFCFFLLPAAATFAQMPTADAAWADLERLQAEKQPAKYAMTPDMIKQWEPGVVWTGTHAQNLLNAPAPFYSQHPPHPPPWAPPPTPPAPIPTSAQP